MSEKLILVYYVSVVGIPENEFEKFLTKISKNIKSNSITNNSEIIVIPVYGESRIECINPKYITNSDLIKKHERLMAELHEHLDNQLEQLKEKKDERK